MILGFILLSVPVTQAQQNWSATNDPAGKSLPARMRNKTRGSRPPSDGSSERRKAEFSVDIFSGATSIVTGLSLDNTGRYQYHYTPTVGFAGDLGYTLTSKLSAHASLGYLQRGAEFDSAGLFDRSRYRLSYIDLWGYLEYASGSQVKFTFLAGLSQSTLIAARLNSSAGNINAMNDFNKIDVGFVAGPGVLLPANKNKIRLRFIFSYGFRDAFAEGHFTEDVKAHNHAYLAQVGYIFN
ncbi:MAG: PorT family protein [Cyclobacteriaceae bacterium]|nr:PorT family protein [Cyclobacteriaceae bacterium]